MKLTKPTVMRMKVRLKQQFISHDCLGIDGLDGRYGQTRGINLGGWLIRAHAKRERGWGAHQICIRTT